MGVICLHVHGLEHCHENSPHAHVGPADALRVGSLNAAKGDSSRWIILCCPLQEIWVFAAARVAPPIPISVCSITVSPNSGTAASVWDF